MVIISYEQSLVAYKDVLKSGLAMLTSVLIYSADIRAIEPYRQNVRGSTSRIMAEPIKLLIATTPLCCSTPSLWLAKTIDT
jgi:hypothetical protein